MQHNTRPFDFLKLFPLREKCPKTEFFLVRISPYSVQIRINTDQKKHQICTLFTQCYCNIIFPENGEFNRWVCWKTYCYVKAIETSIYIKSMGACKRWIKLLAWFIIWVSFWCPHIDNIAGKKQCVEIGF